MSAFNHLLVALDLTEIDDFLIEYANSFAKKLEIPKLTFMHVMQIYDLPDSVSSMFEELEKPLAEIIRDEVKEKVERVCDDDPKTEISWVVEEGDVAETIANYANMHKVDLIVMGNKLGYDGDGISNGRVARQVKSSLLFVPNTSQLEIKNILTVIDFSNISERAFRKSMMIKDKYEAGFFCQYLYNLPLDYFPNRPHEKFIKRMQNFGEKEFLKYLKRMNINDPDLTCEFTLDEDGNPAQKIYKYAMKKNAGLIVIGEKGTSEKNKEMIGAISVKLKRMERNIPVMLVKG